MGYIWLFRSLPLIVVLIILYNFSYLYDSLSLGILHRHNRASYQTINVLGQFSTAVVGLTLVQSAYTAEIIRGGFWAWITGSMRPPPRWDSPPGDVRCGSFCRKRCAPFCLRGSMKSLAAKGTAMVYVLAMPELFYTIQMIYNRTQEVIPLLMVGAAWYR